MTTYIYTIEKFSLDRLEYEIKNSSITVSLAKIESVGTEVTFSFKADISTEEKTTLDTIVASHGGEPLSVVVSKVEVTNESIEVVPTAVKNEYNLRPYGLAHKHIDSSEHVFDITLSNKNGFDIDYADCSVTPKFYDCIFQDHSETRDGIAAVSGSTITTFMARLNEGPAKISVPVNIDYKVETVEHADKIYLWGVFASFENFGEDDILRLQVLDSEDQIITEYDECWVGQVNGIIELNNPDSAAKEISASGTTLRAKYYCKDATKTDIKVWLDHKITLKN